MGTDASANLSLITCNPDSTSQLWKWGSGHRLFHVATARCMVLSVRSKALTLVDCGSGISMPWHCLDGALYTVYQMGLAFSEDKVLVKRDTNDAWIRGGTQNNICQRPYRGKCVLLSLL